MKPRKTDFKRDNKLKLAYKDMGFYSNNPLNGKYAGKPMGDFIGTVPLDEKGRWDLYLLFSLFLSKPIHQREYKYNEETKQVDTIDYPPLIEELEKRGYNPKTIYFEIEKQTPDYTHDGVPKNSYPLGKQVSFFETFDERTEVLKIIKRLFDFDFALRFPSNQPMLRIANKRTKEYWELPISQRQYDLLQEVLL